MQCYECGCVTSETVRTCPGCGAALAAASSPAASAGVLPISYAKSLPQIAMGGSVPEALGYATMGERFLAFLCDATIEAMLVVAFLAVYYAKSELDFKSIQSTALWVIPPAYMALMEFFFHGTLGKRLLRIQVQADSTAPRYPSFLRLLLRESIGKFVSGIVLGIGFLAGISNPKHKTWADRMAGTVVVRTGIVSGRLKFALVPLLLCANIGVTIGLKELPRNYSRTLTDQVITAEKKTDDLHEQMLTLLFGPNNPTVEEYRNRLATLPFLLNEYERQLGDEQDLVLKSRKLARFGVFDESGRLDIYEKAISFRREIAQLARRHMQMVLAFDSQKQTWANVLRDRDLMLRDINLRNNQINEMAGMYIPKTIRFCTIGDSDCPQE